MRANGYQVYICTRCSKTEVYDDILIIGYGDVSEEENEAMADVDKDILYKTFVEYQ